MKQYEIEEVLQHLESAQYIGANKAISVNGTLEASFGKLEHIVMHFGAALLP